MLKRAAYGILHLWNVRKLLTCGHHTRVVGRVEKRSAGGTVTVGSNSLICGSLFLETDASTIRVGNNVFMAAGTTVDCTASVIIEDDVLISYGCVLADSDNHSVRASVRKLDLSDWRHGNHDWTTTVSRPVQVNRGAWIGMRAIILKGVTIGEGAVVGAGSVVTKNVPPWTIVAGNPARVIREIPPNER